MQARLIALLVLAAAGLAACTKPPVTKVTPSGRYAGVGIYSTNAMWGRMVVANPPRDAAAARVSDDEHVIVVVDSQTGEIRQCGDVSGYCTGMNPWMGDLPGAQRLPVNLSAHALPQITIGPPRIEPAASPERPE